MARRVARKDRPLRFSFVLPILFCLVWAPAVLATSITGPYAGTYSSFTSYGDAGTVTITVDA